MRLLRSRSRPLTVFVAVVTSWACAVRTPVERLPLVPGPVPAAESLSALPLAIGEDCVVELATGVRVRGTLMAAEARGLTLRSQGAADAASVTLADADVRVVARPRGRSNVARSWIGAGIGAVASLPLSVSMVGDAILLGALAGSFIGRRTGTERLEILLDRRSVEQRDEGRARGPA